jgi:pimeloyl-ACP methyl ester carboxylesterase
MIGEHVQRFGSADHLVGIAGLPGSPPAEVGVLVLNAGMVHRIGPFRMHVELTRRLNALGYPTLRFDLSTLGDSSASRDSRTRVQQVRGDVHDAMQLLAAYSGCRRFVLVGLCSGAQNAHTVARHDANVVGAIFLDGYAYRTLGYRLRRYLPRLLDPRRWPRLRSRRKPAAPAAAEPVFAVAPSPRREVIADFAHMLNRGMKMFLIYSGGISSYFNHARQFRECFGRVMRRPGVTTAYLAECDHTYILTGDRDRLLGRIERWMGQNFPLPTSGGSS